MVNKIRYNSRENGDIVLMEIRDSSQRILYRNKFRTTDEDGIYNFLKTFEKFSNISIANLINKKLGGDWI